MFFFFIEWFTDSSWFSLDVEFQLYVDSFASVPESIVACQRHPGKLHTSQLPETS